MALNPNIPLGVKSLEVPDPVEAAKERISMQALLQQQQQNAAMQPIQLAQAQQSLENTRMQADVLKKNAAIAERQQQDMKAFDTAFNSDEAYDKDENGIPTLNQQKFEAAARLAGASPQGILDWRKQYGETIAAAAKQRTEINAAEASRNNTMRNAFFSAKDGDSLNAIIDHGVATGNLSSKEAKAVRDGIPKDPAQVKPYIDSLVKQFSTAEQIHQAALDQQAEQEKKLTQAKTKMELAKGYQDMGIEPPADLNLGITPAPARSLEDWKKDIDQLAPPEGETKEINRRAKANLDHVFSLPGNHKKEAEEAYDKARQEMQSIDQAKINKEMMAAVAAGAAAHEMDALPEVLTEPPSNVKDPTTGKIPGNIPYPKLGITPNMLWQEATEHALTGKPLSVGLAGKGNPLLIRTAVMNQASSMAAQAGTTLPEVQAEYKANATALNKIVPQYRATAGFAYTADHNLDLAMDQSARVPRTDSPIANRFIQWANGQTLTGNPALTQFEVYIYTAAREYAKVTGGAAMSAAGLTDSANREAQKLLNAAQTPAAFSAAVTAMKNDMANVTTGMETQIGATSNTIKNFLKVNSGMGGNPALGNAPQRLGTAAPQPAGRGGGPAPSPYNGEKTMVWAKDPKDGQIKAMPFRGTEAQARAKGFKPTTEPKPAQ